MKVLVVDDDMTIRMLVTKIFVRSGDEVANAADGEEAIEKLACDRFDLILLDLMMPRTDGFGVLQFLQTLPEAPPAIVMTAAAPALVENLRPFQVAGVVTKPFELTTIVEMARVATATPRSRPASPS